MPHHQKRVKLWQNMGKYCSGLRDTTFNRKTNEVTQTPILQANSYKRTLWRTESSESDLSTNYSFNTKMFSPVISLIVQMKMSSGTKILNRWFVSTSSLLGDKYSNITPEYTGPHLWLPNQLPGYHLGTFRYRSFLGPIFLQHYSSRISGEPSWFFANSIYCIHRYISIYSLQGFSRDSDWSIFSILWQIGAENRAHSVLHRLCGHIYIYLDFDGLILAPVRSTKFKPKHSKNCFKENTDNHQNFSEKSK